MIWDWDLWQSMIVHDAGHADFHDLTAHLSTLTAELDEAMTAIGDRLGVPFEDLVAALRKAGVGFGL